MKTCYLLSKYYWFKFKSVMITRFIELSTAPPPNYTRHAQGMTL